MADLATFKFEITLQEAQRLNNEIPCTAIPGPDIIYALIGNAEIQRTDFVKALDPEK